MQQYRDEASAIIRLSIPVFIAQIAQTSMGFVDTVMAGGYSATDMAAVAVASSVWMPAILFGIGLLMAMVPMIAQLNGASKDDQIPYQFQQGLYMALFLSIPIGLVLYKAGVIINLMDVEAALTDKTIGYLHAVIWAVPAFLVFQAIRNLCEGMSMTIPAMVIGFIGLAANIPLNWMFVYGKLGAPELGGVGCGVATAIVYWLMAVLMWIYVVFSKKLSTLQLFVSLYAPAFKEQIRLFRLGFPVAASLFFEVTLFAAIAILIAPLGPITVAAHQVAINFSTMIFMLPMSLSAAVSIRVGHLLGKRTTVGAGNSAKIGIWLGVSTACITAILTVWLRDPIIALYSDNVEVATLASSLMLLAAVYQITDSIQVVAAGALRGYKDMRAIFQRTLVSYWVFGLPLGYVLGMTDWLVPAMGAHGFWVGIIIGISTAALLLGLRLFWMRNQSSEFQLAMSER
ncbi:MULTISPECIES: MATE family efflux transporter [Salinivibrio]|uniref:Multidrug resistance protein NorM n=1 Tax=Salinivibrio proteolyticus TaxID=334715 RepID=A0ABY7LJ73_9GAMM|nr:MULTISPECIES: MATE family efflux transporter [Salinivibrio]ODQ00727.1 MATE family efflux transporter [Salinivibrio sp. DV]OOF22101.1 MATE family multidrug exporter [Salinivibrio sp. IB574]QCF35939.1 MATE family efflux transporter [Salinivibrio sp. YCSC6]WBA15970.1 MATE family efflux transporter [Salinivibrio proteolyticus]